MAKLCGCRSGAVVAVSLLLQFGLPALAQPNKISMFYDSPVLVVDTGMHTAQITKAAVDAEGRFGVTGSNDKTLRVWSISDGKLLQTIRVPAGPGNIGKIYAVAMSPDGNIIAAGGWTQQKGDHPIYLFDRNTGDMIRRIAGPPEVHHQLVFSPDGRYLAAGLGASNGLRVYDRDKDWAEAFRDTSYGARASGAAFAADGRLVTSSYDGNIRLYDREFKLMELKKAANGDRPRGVAFNPNGNMLALGYSDTTAVDILDAHTLVQLHRATTDGIDGGSLYEVGWSADGKILFAGGTHRNADGSAPVFAWADSGSGARTVLPAGKSTVVTLAPLLDGQLLIAAEDPFVETLASDYTIRWAHEPTKAEFLGQAKNLAVSSDGKIVDFGFEENGKSALRFDLNTLTLTDDPPADQATVRPKQEGMPITDWENSRFPKFDGKAIDLKPLDTSRSLAIDPRGDRFVLGSTWSLSTIGAQGERIWRRETPSEACAVNITGDSRIVVAAYNDGTIRWHRMDDGRELLALMVLGDKKNWVAWTPEGYYAARPGAHGILKWHVNRGFDHPAMTKPASAIARLRRPDLLKLVLGTLDTYRALKLAELADIRNEVQAATDAEKPPGARLHILAIGVSKYGDSAKHLHLDFAHKDASDLASTLLDTQSSQYNKQSGLYGAVLPIYLDDARANKIAIFEAFESVYINMAKGENQDLAVVLFSGHGTVIDNQFYFLPYGVDATTAASIKASAISAGDLQAEVLKLSEHGRVLVLLDACRSGAFTVNGTKLPNATDVLKAMAIGGVTVLTSSRGTKLSREVPLWKNGAFTKIVLEALGSAADEDKDGIITISELTAYVARKLPKLTKGNQVPGLEQRFLGEIFIAGL